MQAEILLALILKKVDEKIKNLPSPSRGPRGQRGSQGEPGQDFIFSEHEEVIRAWAKEFALSFEDLTQDQIESLRGEKGRDGYNGKDGRDFIFDEHEEEIKSFAKEFALKFEDFSPEQIESLRGEKGENGKDGRDGYDFNFENNRDAIADIIYKYIESKNEDYKLKLSDLSDDDLDQLRGPRGRDGKDGRDFNFDDHRDFFLGLKPKFSDFTEEEKEELKLRFENLTDEEKKGLKLRFEDLTDEDRQAIKGSRGPRGQRGSQGDKGDQGVTGPQGIRGIPGPQGTIGLTGRAGTNGQNGRDGQPGADAPFITEIEVEKIKADEIEFVFRLSDGSVIRSNQVKLPSPVNYYSRGGGGGGGSSGGGSGGQGSTLEFFDEGDSLGQASQLNFTGLGITAFKVGDRVTVDFDIGATAGILLNVARESDTYEGSAVRMEEITLPVFMSEWGTMSNINFLSDTRQDSQAVNALADSYENANVIGLIEEITSPTRCNIRIYGPTPQNYVGLDVTEEYYLSDTVPGGLVKTADAPTTPTHILLKLGQPISPTQFLFAKGERLIRA